MSEVDRLLARAILWHWTAQAFWYPRDDLLASAGEPDRRRELEAALEAAAADQALAAWPAARSALEGVPSELLAEEYTHLFARQVKVPLHETSYAERPWEDRSQGRAELGTLYAAFGLETSSERPELPDHLSAECEFMAALLAKEAYALAQAWQEPAEVTRLARERFVGEHLARWLPRFRERLGSQARHPFYPAAASLLLGLLAAEQGARAAVASGTC